MDIVKVKLSELKPDPNNARRHSSQNILAIKQSLQENPQYRPFVVQAGTNRICVGNCMYTAMVELGITEAWAEVRELTDKQFVRLSITDNRTSELGEWDENLLAEIKAEEIDLPGWDTEDIQIGPDNFDTDFQLPNGEQSEMRTVTFTLHKEQLEFIKNSLDEVIQNDNNEECFDNTNKNGNALYMVFKQWDALKR